MSDSPKQLDRRLREQVASLHKPPSGTLDDMPLGTAAQRRVLHALKAEAARLRRKREQRSQWLIGGTATLLAAAAVLLFVRTGTQPANTASTRSEVEYGAACRLPVLSAGSLPTVRGTTLQLDALGSLVAQPLSQLAIESSSACELVVRLSAGTLAGDLHSLRPARLVIRTQHGEVVVTGTRFSVHSDAGLEVLLESGVVDVQLADAERVRIQPGTRLRKLANERAAQQQALTHADMQRLDHWLASPSSAAPNAAPEPHTPAHPERKAAQLQPTFDSSNAALTAAESARRARQWSAARDAYRAASQGRDGGAEVALLRWTRFELDQDQAASALRLLSEHKRRFHRGSLGAEAGWLEVQARKQLGQMARAKRAARALVKRHPGTPQAAAAAKLIEVE